MSCVLVILHRSCHITSWVPRQVVCSTGKLLKLHCRAPSPAACLPECQVRECTDYNTLHLHPNEVSASFKLLCKSPSQSRVNARSIGYVQTVKETDSTFIFGVGRTTQDGQELNCATHCCSGNGIGLLRGLRVSSFFACCGCEIMWSSERGARGTFQRKIIENIFTSQLDSDG